MPNPPQHNRVTAVGTLLQSPNGGSDIFSFSVADSSAMSPQALATAFAPLAHALWEGNSLQLSTQARLDAIVVEEILESGKVATSYRQDVSPIIGDNGNGYPTLLCHALTLETGQVDNRGRKIRGRIYPPATMSQVIGSTSNINSADAYAEAWTNWIFTLNSVGAEACVASSTNAGHLVAINGVSADTIIDTQRRRKNGVTGQRTNVKPLS